MTTERITAAQLRALLFIGNYPEVDAALEQAALTLDELDKDIAILEWRIGLFEEGSEGEL